MKKKNVLTAAVSLSLVACLSIGATLAYFSDTTEEKHNVFTTGKVDITLVDESREHDGWKTGTPDGDGITYDKVMPGDILSKYVGFDPVSGTSDAYVALKIGVTIDRMPNATEEITEEDLRTNIEEQIKAQVAATNATAVESGESALWTERSDILADGSMVFYYNTAVSGDMNEQILFDHINILDTWENEYADAKFTINVQAFAVQAENLTAPTEEGSTAVEQLNELIKKTPMPLG